MGLFGLLRNQDINREVEKYRSEENAVLLRAGETEGGRVCKGTGSK